MLIVGNSAKYFISCLKQLNVKLGDLALWLGFLAPPDRKASELTSRVNSLRLLGAFVSLLANISVLYHVLSEKSR